MALLIRFPGVFGSTQEQSNTQKIISGEEDTEIQFYREDIFVDPTFVIGVNNSGIQSGDIKQMSLARCRDGSAFFIEMSAEELVTILNKYRTLDLTFSMQ
jgi:hypothetical protein